MKDVAVVDKEQLVSAIKALNGKGFGDKIKTIGVKKEDMLQKFVDLVESLDDTQAADLPQEVVSFYEDLMADELDKPADDEGDADSDDEGDAEADSDSDDEGDADSDDEGDAEEEKPAKPTKTTKPTKKEEEKAAPKKEEKPAKSAKSAKSADTGEKKEKKPNPFNRNVEKTKFGSGVGSQAARIDECLIKGGLKIKEICDKAGCTGSRFKSHVKWLTENQGVIVTVKDEKYYGKKG